MDPWASYYRDGNSQSCHDQILLVLNELHSHEKTECWILKSNSKTTWECPSAWLVHNWILQQYHIFIYIQCIWAHLLDYTYFALINVHWQTLFDAGAPPQTNPLSMPLSRAWGLHPIAMAVSSHALTETHTKQWQTANTLTLCHTYQIRITLLNSVKFITHYGSASYIFNRNK